MTTTITTPKNRKTKIFGITMSRELAESIFSWGNGFILVALIIGVAATWAVLLSSNVKEAYLKRDVADANARGEEAKAEAAEATARAAEATARAAKAQLELAIFKAPRQLDVTQLAAFDVMAKKYTGTNFVFSVQAGDAEATNLMVQLGNALRTAGWNWEPCSRGVVTTYPSNTPASCHTVLFGNVIQSGARLETVRDELVDLLNDSGLKTTTEPGPSDLDVIHILIGAKPR